MTTTESDLIGALGVVSALTFISGAFIMISEPLVPNAFYGVFLMLVATAGMIVAAIKDGV